jgi:quercetin dioxygenase-like cupin family protein
MSAYSKVNLKELEDATGGGGGKVEAHFGRSQLDSRELGVSYFRYAPGFQPTMGHRHREQEEAYVVVGGAGRVKLDDEIVQLRQWDVVRVAPETTRAFAAGPDGLELVVVGSARPEGGDGERVEDWWTD